MENKFKKIIIVGPGASGKDYIKNILVKQYGFNNCLLYTTRPKRSYEKDGIDYIFLSVDEYKKVNKEDKKVNIHKRINNQDWYYFFHSKDIANDEYNLFVMSPDQIYALSDEFIKSCYILYINPPKDILRKRLNERNDADTADRRIESDIVDFKDYELYTHEICDTDNIENLLEFIVNTYFRNK